MKLAITPLRQPYITTGFLCNGPVSLGLTSRAPPAELLLARGLRHNRVLDFGRLQTSVALI